MAGSSKDTPFLLVHRRNLGAVSPERLPEGFSELHVADPQRLDHATFVGLVQRLDDLAFGPMGLSMPGWVFYDCGVMPGIIFGFASPAGTMRPWVRRVLDVPAGYQGLVPRTLFIAIAMLPEGAWLVYTLTSLNEVAPGATSERLVRDTLAAGLSMLPVRTLYGTLQWRSRVLPHYTSLGPLEVLTAWTPAHDIPSTLTFRVAVNPEATSRLLAGSEVVHPDAPAPNRVLDVDRPADLQALQRQVERGARARVVAPPQVVGRYTLGLLHLRDPRPGAGRAGEARP